MNLVNWEGSAVFGPGSEWFWTMAQFVVVAVTLVGLYRQLRIQSSQNAMEQLASFDHEWESERFIRHRLDVLIALRDGVDSAHVPLSGAGAIADFWERIAALTRDGHVDRHLLWNDLGGICQAWWVILTPYAQRNRVAQGASLYEHFEWLAGEMAAISRRAGQPVIDKLTMASVREAMIAANLGRLRVEQALRTVVFEAPEAATISKRRRRREPATIQGA